MPAAASTVEPVGLVGKHYCLDLANTMDPRLGDHPHDMLATYADLVSWAVSVGIVTADHGGEHAAGAAEQPAEAQAALRRAKELRESIYRVFSATAAGRTPEPADLDALQTAYAAAAGHARIVAQADAYRWSWPVSPPTLDEMLWPVAFSAVELLTSPQVQRVKECPGSNDCGWLFFDQSKNGSRHWCSMETCGSRSKMRRHYARKRAEHLTANG